MIFDTVLGPRYGTGDCAQCKNRLPGPTRYFQVPKNYNITNAKGTKIEIAFCNANCSNEYHKEND